MRAARGGGRRVPEAVAAAVAAVVGLSLGWLSAQLWWPESLAAAAPTPTPAAAPTASPATTPAVTATPVAPAPSAPSPSPDLDLASHSVTDADSIWVVVNKRRAIEPADYEPEDLVRVAGAASGVRMRAEAAAAMEALADAAADAGAAFRISTAYRDRGFQASLYDGYVARSGRASADRYSARPGHSEHQTGLAADLNAEGCDLERCFADTTAGRFVAEHAWEHGFIVRYPDGAEGVTGFTFEPWHLRYVGVELAAEMRDRGVATLEELFGLEPAPDYA